MNTMHRTRNVAARMGRWSADHWKTATFGWLAFVVVAFVLGGMVGTTLIDTSKPGPGESGRRDAILDAGFERPAGESVLIQSRSLRAGTPAFDSAVEDVVARISKLQVVKNVRSPLARGNAGQIASDGRSALVRRHRRWAILLAFIVGALLTPPDVISQCVRSVTLLALYEGAILVGARVAKARGAEGASGAGR